MKAQGMFHNILLADYYGTFHDTPYHQGASLLFLLTFKTSLSEEEMMSTIYVFT
jgi:hypothetical protein